MFFFYRRFWMLFEVVCCLRLEKLWNLFCLLWRNILCFAWMPPFAIKILSLSLFIFLLFFILFNLFVFVTNLTGITAIELFVLNPNLPELYKSSRGILSDSFYANLSALFPSLFIRFTVSIHSGLSLSLIVAFTVFFATGSTVITEQCFADF